jgi:hypothetical protein
MERLEGCVHALSTADDTATSSTGTGSGSNSSRSSSGGGGGGGDHQYHNKPAARVSEVPSQSSSGANSTTLSGGSSQTLVTTVELADREAQLLVPVPRTRLTKLLWRQFMDTPDDDFAEELTRIDWVMFSAMRPRDIVRHISLSTAEKRGRSRSVENVDRMIAHFNHVACWVANIILFRDKPKHRAQALEKFMNIAWVRIKISGAFPLFFLCRPPPVFIEVRWIRCDNLLLLPSTKTNKKKTNKQKLRKMNNYNALGAIVAGISGNAVYRLIQTRELVSPKAQKDFMRLEILMGTHKGHFAYRLAWRNSPTPRIPFLPLHRRDLVSADEGNRTFFDAPPPPPAAAASPTSPTSPTSSTMAAALVAAAAGGGVPAVAAGVAVTTAAARPRINWKKFEIMGEVIVSLHQSQAAPYPDLERKLDVQRLVLDCEVIKDEDVSFLLNL